MKLTHLIAQFLYRNKRLDLHGIGSFLLDNSIIIDAESGKQGPDAGIEGIRFESNPNTKEDPELIAFISGYTGKIKALAAADLNSHLELAKQFLNIGKPFLFEGIGSLTKHSTGEYSFSPGSILTEKLTEQKPKHSNGDNSYEEPVSDFKSALYKTDKKTTWKKPVLFSLIIIGAALAIWGGYTVYKNSSGSNTKEIEQAVASEKPIEKDDNLSTAVADTSHTETTIAATNTAPIESNKAGFTKFVLETSNADRAFQRYNRLKTYEWNVQLETKDSVWYKIFMLLPVALSDTSRVLDSLSIVNGRKVTIEH